ncbi:MAG: hypothetical protein HDT20_01335 [Oscillibacter sp.]|nr:hypothetical protein [Oscillibacter sp.]
MEKLEITVTKMTADALHKVADVSGIPLGEVVDRYAVNVAPDDPDNAFILLLEHYLICISRLSKEDSARVFGDICGLFLGSIPPEDLDDMVANIKSTRNWEDPAVQPLTAEEHAAFRRSADDMVQSIKGEYLRTVFHGLLHG